MVPVESPLHKEIFYLDCCTPVGREILISVDIHFKLPVFTLVVRLKFDLTTCIESSQI